MEKPYGACWTITFASNFVVLGHQRCSIFFLADFMNIDILFALLHCFLTIRDRIQINQVTKNQSC